MFNTNFMPLNLLQVLFSQYLTTKTKIDFILLNPYAEDQFESFFHLI